MKIPVAVVLLCFGTSALAQSGAGAVAPTPTPGSTGAPGNTGDGAASLQSLDRDADGSLNRTEARADPELFRQFAMLDRDRNGRLDKSEFARFEVSSGGARGGLPGDTGDNSESGRPSR